MGKRGSELREKKKETVYSMTRLQIESMQRMAAEKALRDKKTELDKYLEEKLEKEFAERTRILREAMDGDPCNDLSALMTAVAVTVLCKHFGWKPLNGSRGDKLKKLKRFTDLVREEFNAICDDDDQDIRSYAEESYRKYGVRLDAEEEEENWNG